MEKRKRRCVGGNSPKFKKKLEFSKIPIYPDCFFLGGNFGKLEVFWNFKGIDQKEIGITFSFYWQCLNRRKTLKTGVLFG